MSDQQGMGAVRRRRWPWVVGALASILVVLVLLAPTVVGWIAPGIASGAINGSINGKATVGGVSLSWLGDQRVGPVVVTDAQGRQVADLNVHISRGLLGLVTGGGSDLGRITVSGSASVVRGPDGTLNVATLPKSAATPGAAPNSPGPTGNGPIPRGLKAELVLDKLSLEYLDESKTAPVRRVSIPALSGTASIDGSNATLDLAAAVEYQRTGDPAPAPGGTLSLKGAVNGFADNAGNLTLSKAMLNADVEVKDLAVAVADAIAGMDNKLVAAIGEKFQASIKAKGTVSDADATIVASSRAVQIDVGLKTASGVLTSSRPGTIAIQGGGLMPLIPGLDAAPGGMKLDRLPDLTARIDALSLPLPAAGKPLDLRGGSFSVALETTQTTGTVSVPQSDGKPGPAQPMTIAPLKASLASTDLAGATTLKASSSATIGGRSGGELAIDLSVSGALDDSGSPRMPRKIDGSAALTGVATALAQPLVDALGVQLAQDVGPQLDISLVAASAEGSGELAPTLLTLNVKSANLNTTARARIEGSKVSLPGDGARLTMVNAGPLAGRLLAASGLSVESGLPVTITLKDVVADLDRLKGPKPDLRGIGGILRVETGAAQGTLAMADQPVKRFGLSPVVAMLDAKDLAAGVTLKVSGSAKVDGQDAGMMDVDLTASGLVHPDGSAVASIPAIAGEATIDNISTAIAQPLVEAMGLDLPAGVGPKLAITLKASGKGGAVPSGGLPATEMELSVKSANLNGSAALTLDGRTIRKRGAESVFTLRAPGLLAARAAQKSGIALSDGGYAKVTLKDFAIVLDDRWAPRLDETSADAEVNIGGFSITTTGPNQPPAPVALGQLIAAARLAPATVPVLDIRGSGAHQGAEFFVQGKLQLPGLIAKDGTLNPAGVRPLGTLDLNNVPTSLAALGLPAPAPAKPGEKPRPDLARLVRDAVGPTATVKLAATHPEGQSPGSRAMSLTLAAPRFSGSASGLMDDASRALTKLDFRGQMTPELAATLIDMLGAGLESKPTLLSPATLTITATPFTIPLAKDGSMDLSRAGEVSLKIGLEGRAMVGNVVVKNPDGAPRDLGTVGLENALLTASIPLSSLAPGSGAKPAQVSITAGVLAAADKRIVDFKAGARVDLAGGSPQGELKADANLKVLDAAWLDNFLGKPRLLADGLGPSATLEAAAVVQFPRTAPPAGSTEPAFERAALTASITAANLATAQPLKATMLPDRMSIDAPMVLKWTMSESWANTYLLTPPKPGEAANAVFTAPTQFTVSLFKLSMATGADPFKPGVFLADIQADSPGATLALGAGKDAVVAALKTFTARLTGGKDPGTLGFSLSLADAGGGPAPDAKPAVAFAGGVYGFADASGAATPDAARITMNGTAVSIPTAIVDALAHQGGLLNEALGPRVNLDVKAQGLSKSGGNLTIDAVSPRAEARITGSVHDGTLRLSPPAPGKASKVATLHEATPALGAMLVKGLPVLGTFEKRPEDGPATLNAYAMSIPIDGDMRKLNGQLVVDLGAAHFGTSDAFKAILKVTGQKDSGTIGQRMDPFEIDFKDGVGTYKKFTIPLGEFRLATSGVVDLVNKQMDVVTYVPFGALTDEAAGRFNTGLGKLMTGAIPLIERATMVPIRTKGSFDKPETRPDLELFAREFIGTLRPDRLIKDLFK